MPRLLQRTNKGVANPLRVLFDLHPELGVSIDAQLLRMGTTRYVLEDRTDPDRPVVLGRYRQPSDLALDRTGAVPMPPLPDLTDDQMQILQAADRRRLVDSHAQRRPDDVVVDLDVLEELAEIGVLRPNVVGQLGTRWVPTHLGSRALSAGDGRMRLTFRKDG